MVKKICIMHIAQAAGGVEQYLSTLLKYLDQDKFENILVCSYDYNCDRFKGIVNSIIQLDMKRDIGLHDLPHMFQIRKIIKKYKPDIVYAHSSKAGALTRIADIWLKNVCIYNPHGWAFCMRTPKKELYYRIEKILSPFCDKIVCISESESRSAQIRKLCEKEKLAIIVNGIEIKEFIPDKSSNITRKSLGVADNAFVIGMVGRICKQKAPDIFVQAARLIKQKIPNAHFIIVGSGEMESEIRSFAQEHGILDSLTITGWVQNPRNYVELFDVALLLSRWEGFGLVLPEYMLSKKPIVASSVDAIPDIIADGKNGILVSADNPEAVSNAVIELYQNESMRKKMTENGYQDVLERYDVKRVAYEHEKLFLRLLEE